jgi:hypothetical protein
MANIESAKKTGHPIVNDSDGRLAVALYKLLVNWTNSCLAILAIVFAVAPEYILSSGLIGRIIDLSINHWPKMASDFAVLSTLNFGFQYNFVGYNIAALLFSTASLLSITPPLIFILSRNHRPLDEFNAVGKRHFIAVVAFCFIVFLEFLSPHAVHFQGGY